MEQDTLTLNIKFKYAILGFIITLAAIFIYYILTKDVIPAIPSHQYFLTILKIFSVGIALTVFFYKILELYKSNSISIVNIDLGKKNKSLDIISDWNSDDVINSTIIGIKILEAVKGKTGPEATNIIDRDDVKRKAILIILNFLEKMSISVKSGVVDEKVLRDFFKIIVNTYYLGLKPYVDNKRHLFNDNEIYKPFEDMANAWSTVKE